MNQRFKVNVEQLDFVDIGCSTGGSFNFAKGRYGKNGLGIDIEPEKVKQSINNSAPAVQLNACNIKIFNDNATKVVTMLDFLEHLPDLDTIARVLKESTRIASNSIFIKGPMFYDEYLNNLGLQFYWSNWTGHPTHVEPVNIIEIMEKNNQSNYKLHYIDQVYNSKNKCIHPLNGHEDRHDYDPVMDPVKDMNIVFEKKIYKQFTIEFNLV